MVQSHGREGSGECYQEATYRPPSVHASAGEKRCCNGVTSQEGDEIVHWDDTDATGVVCQGPTEGCPCAQFVRWTGTSPSVECAQ